MRGLLHRIGRRIFGRSHHGLQNGRRNGRRDALPGRSFPSREPGLLQRPPLPEEPGAGRPEHRAERRDACRRHARHGFHLFHGLRRHEEETTPTQRRLTGMRALPSPNRSGANQSGANRFHMDEPRCGLCEKNCPAAAPACKRGGRGQTR